jgi:hypothetical protein
MNNKNYYKIVVFVLLTGVVGAFTHCVQNNPIGGASSNSSRAPSSNSTAPAPSPEQILNQAQVEVGLKNFEQINYTFAELTGVPVTNTAVNNTYNAVEPTLPGGNEVKVLQSSNQVAIVRLAAEYCNQLINTQNFLANRDAILGANVLTQAPLALDKVTVVNRITNAFWGQGVIDQTELDTARMELVDVYDDVVSMDASQTSTTTTNKAVRAVCTAALSSAYVTIM